MIQPTNDKTTPELPDSATMGGKMGGTAFKASRELGLLRVPASWLLAFLLAAGGAPAFAQQETAACAPVIARVVSLQGTVEVQRAGTTTWLGIRRLDTSICTGDRLRTTSSSRAALFVQPETLVRVDQNTTLTLHQSTDEISVEFSMDEVSRIACSEQTCGAGYFITRFPKKFKVKTPHMNAAVEGTEFMVAVRRDSTQLTVLEGKVGSESVTTGDRKLVEAGQSLASGAAGAGVITAMVKPKDAVQWVLRFPPLRDAGATGERADIARAETALQVGRVDEALAEVNGALASNPHDANALALRSVIQLAKNDKIAAMESARAANAAEPTNVRGWLSLSYAQQASFELGAALESAQRAVSLEGGSSLAHARVAELLLSLGDARRAEAAARKAVARNDAESHAHSILGFVHLAQMDTMAARAAFQAAIDRDSFSALPRLGLGLATIREGELVAGREQIEIAVALDPSNSLLRSYVGKAYYEENTRARDELAAAQLAMAKELDSRDPTPSLYDAIRLQTANQPVAALSEVRRSISLNDNRAIYRSRFKLDEDLAVRGASRGRIYRDLGFEELAVLDSFASIDNDPGDFSGHRLLADVYSNLPRHEIARVNELFTSQVLQPLNLSPVPPQLGETNLFILDSAGPSEVGFNEFTPVFSRDGVTTHVSGTVGGNDTWGDDVAFAALQGRWSLSVGQFHFETEGFRPNNDLEQDTYNVFVQYRQSERTNVMTELRATRREQGDLRLLFDPDSFDPFIRQEDETESVRFGAHHVISAQSEWLASVVLQQARLEFELPPDYLAATDVDSFAGEFQSIHHWDDWRMIAGLRQTYRDQSESQNQFGEVTNREFEFDGTSLYAYTYWQANPSVDVTVGLSADWIEGRAVDKDEVNPKFGLAWEFRPGSRLRMAALRGVQPESFSRQDIQPRLEPTQVAGFNQVFAATQGETEWRYALAYDQDLPGNLYVGAEVSMRDLEIPFLFEGPPDFVTEATAREESGKVRLNWAPLATIAASAAYQYDRRENEAEAVFPEGLEELTTHRVSMGARYFHRLGLSLEASATYVDQRGQFIEFIPIPPFLQSVPGGDRFWVIDASVSYRFPRRAGILTIAAKNLADERIRFQDVDPENPEIFPERFVSMKFTVAF